MGKDVRPKTVRIELPFDIWCEHCSAHVGKGVRYNARKKEVGKYFSTRIFEFSMTCHLCSGPIVMKTDPEHRDYAMVSGARRKTETYDSKDARVIELPDKAAREKLEQDPMFKLEHKTVDREVAKKQDKDLKRLISLRSDQYEDDYRASRLIRSGFRKVRRSSICQRSIYSLSF